MHVILDSPESITLAWDSKAYSYAYGFAGFGVTHRRCTILSELGVFRMVHSPVPKGERRRSIKTSPCSRHRGTGSGSAYVAALDQQQQPRRESRPGDFAGGPAVRLIELREYAGERGRTL